MGYLNPNPLAPFPSPKQLVLLDFCRPWKGVANWEGHAPPAWKAPPQKIRRLWSNSPLGEGFGVGVEKMITWLIKTIDIEIGAEVWN